MEATRESTSLATPLRALLSDAGRLYRLEGDGPIAALHVERWSCASALSSCFELKLDALSTDAGLSLEDMLGQCVRLITALADGGACTRSGLVSEACLLGSNGGLARYRLTIVPWLWILSQAWHSRVFQDLDVLDIVAKVFGEYREYAAWSATADARRLLREVRPRSCAVQYRETDLHFIERLLAEEGLGYCFVKDTDAPSGHTLIIFGDSSQLPEDATSAAAPGGLRFHRAASVEENDTVQALGPEHTLGPTDVTLLSWDYKTMRVTTANVPVDPGKDPGEYGRREVYDPAGAYAFADSREARHYAELAAQAQETLQRSWHGRGTVRTARVGTRFRVSGTPWQAARTPLPAGFVYCRIIEAGVNNLPETVVSAVAGRLGAAVHDPPDALGDARMPDLHDTSRPPFPEPDDTLIGGPWAENGTEDEWPSAGPCWPADPDVEDANTQERTGASAATTDGELWRAAAEHGYAQRFTAVDQVRPWRPVLTDGTGLRLNPVPTAPGPQTAIVVGPHGETTPGAAGPLHTDPLGRLKVRFHWMAEGASCWLRVLQRYAGAGHGAQFLPRIGQEVLVNFMNDDIDRPVIVGALYNGQGEAGIAPTPGERERAPDPSLYAKAADFRPTAQGNLAGGNSPAWHGQSPGTDGHRNAAALSGIKTQGFDGRGYNQLVFDDSDRQGRVQMATTQAATQLNLGHLIHQADNYRGSFRGTGFELRTDASGAVRGERGVLLTTWAQPSTEPAADVTAPIALMRQHAQLAETMSAAARRQGTVPLAGVEGIDADRASSLDERSAPLPALERSLASRTEADDYAKADPRPGVIGSNAVPHTKDALVVLAGRAGIVTVADGSLHLAAGETLNLGSGGDTDLVAKEQLRIHAGQAIGMLAGTQDAEDIGLNLTAGAGDVVVQAQHDALSLTSRDDLAVTSTDGSVELSAKQVIHLANAHGAFIHIEGGNIRFGCPGKLSVHAGNHEFEGPARLDLSFPVFPGHVCIPCLLRAAAKAQPFVAR